MRTTQIHCVEQFWMQVGPSRLSPGLKKGPKGALDQKCQFCHTEKFSMNEDAHLFLSSLLTQKSTFCAFSSKFEPMFLRKIHFSANPILAQKGLFFGPEGPILTQNTKSIV